MNNENFHPVCHEPPVAHALHHWNEQTKTLSYEYNGEDILSVPIPDSQDVGFRHGSDGSMQSIQYMQQIYITVEKPMWVTMTFRLSADTVNMRPHRARSGQAILAQNGRRLVSGVNGLYDADQDLLIDFNGCRWKWQSPRILQDESGKSVASISVRLCEKPLFINLRMHYYKNHLGYCYYRPWESKPKKKAVAGWCSWEAYRRNIDSGKIAEISRFMAENLKDYGLEYIQVDDGYQKMPLPYDPKLTMAEGWMACDEEKFPAGHEGIVKTIRSQGFCPAIWTNANITNPEFPKYNGDAILYHEGKPMKGEWIDYLYNCTPQTLAKHVTPLFQKLRELGYGYVKIDAIRHLLFDGLHEAVRLGIMSNREAQEKFRAYLQATRDGLGNDVYYLASWGELHEAVGLVDACRICMDANPTWAGIRMQLFETARWFHTQRVLFLNDPDHVCVRTKPEWAKSVLSLISLSGELYMLSDTPEAYTEEKLEIIRKTLPPLQCRTAETGPLNLEYPAYAWTKLHGFAVQSHDSPVEPEDITAQEVYNMAGEYPTMDDDHPFSTLWAFHLQQGDQNWCVLGRFATVPLRSCGLPLDSLGLEPDTEYHAFDFWKQEYLGKVSGSLSVRELAVGECQIVALRRAEKRPQFLASTRHVSMDAVSVQNVAWEGSSLIVLLSGVPGTVETYYFSESEGFRLRNADCTGADVRCEKDGRLLKAAVAFREKEARLRLNYKEAK